MRLTSLLRSAAVLGVMAATMAGAQDLVVVDTVEGWDIMVDPTIGNGCLIAADYEDGSNVRIGFDVTNDTAYVLALNSGWEGVVADETYAVSFDLDGAEYEGEAMGLFVGDMPGVDIAFDNMDFLQSLTEATTMTLYHDDAEVMSIDLTGSGAALLAAVECQEKQG